MALKESPPFLIFQVLVQTLYLGQTQAEHFGFLVAAVMIRKELLVTQNSIFFCIFQINFPLSR